MNEQNRFVFVNDTGYVFAYRNVNYELIINLRHEECEWPLAATIFGVVN